MSSRPRPSARNRKSRHSRSRATKIVLIVLGLSIALAWFAVRHSPAPASSLAFSLDDASLALPSHLTVDFPAAASAERPLYPYSVIPRGATSARELQTALEADPVAAAHYAGFRAAEARVLRVHKDRPVYVSYRLGNQIFWTRRPVLLHAGETLLTDGANLARTRCGNRVSVDPVGPTSPAEPPAHILNVPAEPRAPETFTEPLPTGPMGANTPEPMLIPGGAPPPPGSGGPGEGGGMVPPLPPFFCCGGVAGGPGSPSSIPPPLPQPGPPPLGPPPPVSTPEPGSLLLLAVGLTALLLFCRSRGR